MSKITIPKRKTSAYNNIIMYSGAFYILVDNSPYASNIVDIYYQKPIECYFKLEHSIIC